MPRPSTDLAAFPLQVHQRHARSVLGVNSVLRRTGGSTQSGDRRRTKTRYGPRNCLRLRTCFSSEVARCEAVGPRFEEQFLQERWYNLLNISAYSYGCCTVRGIRLAGALAVPPAGPGTLRRDAERATRRGSGGCVVCTPSRKWATHLSPRIVPELCAGPGLNAPRVDRPPDHFRPPFSNGFSHYPFRFSVLV